MSMERKLRTCCVCHNQYKFCPNCGEDKGKPNFYFIFCSENCRDIYNVTSSFENGKISTSEANEKISKLDLSNIKNFGESYVNSIGKIKTSKTENVVIESVVQATYKDEIEKNDNSGNIMAETAEVSETAETAEDVNEKNYSRKSKKRTYRYVE